jgi:ribosome-binding ATPase YchF (GTP1/OBG family)
MRLEIGIVGLPNVGKSTLFKVLTKQEVNIANYPFATIDPNVGIVSVHDDRLSKLAAMSKSKKVISAVVEFYDIAGLVKGANKGEGLGNQFLANIKETQAIIIVLRVFENPDIIHVENSVDPLRDLDIINTELILKDLELIEKQYAKAEAEARTGKKEAVQLHGDLDKIKKALEEGKLPVSSPELLGLIRSNKTIREMNLLSAKKQLYLLNGEEDDVSAALKDKIKELGGEYLVMNLAGAGSVDELTGKAYSILNLASFFTTGEDETRAWTIEKGTLAPQAAGVIHTDFEQKFIRLEAIPYDKLVEAGSWGAAKQKGWLKLEGKDYEVQDGDVVVVRHG